MFASATKKLPGHARRAFLNFTHFTKLLDGHARLTLCFYHHTEHTLVRSIFPSRHQARHKLNTLDSCPNLRLKGCHRARTSDPASRRRTRGSNSQATSLRKMLNPHAASPGCLRSYRRPLSNMYVYLPATQPHLLCLTFT
jgi:hypothetical protein